MDISDKLADLNWQRNQDWKTPFTSENARPAVFAFDGDVYTGLMPIRFHWKNWMFCKTVCESCRVCMDS
jgi:cytoplasmic iron level regulating protein YaaA (DUF328/UPF0246 family)